MALNTMDVTKTQKNPGVIYFGLAVPGAGLELTLTSGVPDSTENPNAKMVGLTESGSVMSLSKTITEEFFDEYKESLEQNIDQVGGEIRCSASQIFDIDVLEAVTVGMGTQQTVTGKKKIKLGEGTLTYSSVAIVSPLKSDPTKYAVFQLYKAYQVNNLEINISRQTRSKMDLVFRGVGISSRAADDRLGAIWWQTA